ASNPSLAWTLAAVTNRNVIVPPNPGAMGAWGIGLRAMAELGAAALFDCSPLDLDVVLRAEITERTEFACRDRACQMLCPIERTTIVVEGTQHVALSGGACPKFEVAAQSLPKLDKYAPNPFDARTLLLRKYERESPGGPVVGIPSTGALAGCLPWLSTFLHRLGYTVKVLRSDAKSLARGEQLCNSFDSCSPTKIAHAICDAAVPMLFFPKVLNIADPDGPGGQTCVTEQSMPEMTEQSLRAQGRDVRVVRPRLSFAKGLDGASVIASLLPWARELAAGPLAIRSAVVHAARAQRAYQRSLRAMGEEALAYARERGIPIVVVCGPLHVIHDPATNATIPTLLRQNGAMAIPMDAFPVRNDVPGMRKVYWAEPNRCLRVAEAARRTGDVFPLMLSSFGCGPASFTEQYFHAILEGYPHTILESDGHGGTAGFVTRIQAFLHSVRQARSEANRVPAPAGRILAFVDRGRHRGSYLDRNVRYVFLSSIEYLGPLFAAVYRAYGYDAAAAPPLSKTNFELGRRDCSGKECLSYQLVWGAFREYLRDNPPDPGKDIRLVQISGEICRAGVFGIRTGNDLTDLDGPVRAGPASPAAPLSPRLCR
ncbi:MAG: acyl-CoA dehydratase activase-related protein, partial [Polyangiaceae bacterium]|nr:acyl-CoA dehydratase activase-related protein [Polyangiaceae bacterium]